MNITFSTFEGNRNRPERLYTINLKPKDTMNIIDSPAGWYITDYNTRVQLHILPYPATRTPEEIFFKFQAHEETYLFISQSGFGTDEEHLDWLVSLEKIPMYTDNLPDAENPHLLVGYVQFLKDVA